MKHFQRIKVYKMQSGWIIRERERKKQIEICINLKKSCKFNEPNEIRIVFLIRVIINCESIIFTFKTSYFTISVFLHNFFLYRKPNNNNFLWQRTHQFNRLIKGGVKHGKRNKQNKKHLAGQVSTIVVRSITIPTRHGAIVVVHLYNLDIKRSFVVKEKKIVLFCSVLFFTQL